MEIRWPGHEPAIPSPREGHYLQLDSNQGLQLDSNQGLQLDSNQGPNAASKKRLVKQQRQRKHDPRQRP